MQKLVAIACVCFYACCSVQKKDIQNQVSENKEAVKLNSNAIKTVENSNLTLEEKKEIKTALQTSTNTINNSSNTLAQTEQIINEETEKRVAAAIKQANELNFKLMIVIIILSVIIILFLIVPFIRKVIYWLSPAGQALRNMGTEIKKHMDKLK